MHWSFTLCISANPESLFSILTGWQGLACTMFFFTFLILDYTSLLKTGFLIVAIVDHICTMCISTGACSSGMHAGPKGAGIQGQDRHRLPSGKPLSHSAAAAQWPIVFSGRLLGNPPSDTLTSKYEESEQNRTVMKCSNMLNLI